MTHASIAPRISVIIHGHKWDVVQGVEGLTVCNGNEDRDEEFAVVDPTTRRIVLPASFSHESLGSAILRAAEIEEGVLR